MSQTPSPPHRQKAESDAGRRTAALSRELSEFLLELSIGVHRYAMYPPRHPSLLPAAENIIGRLGEIFLERRSLSIGVAKEQLVIEGVATDSRHPVLRDLARRLHAHQLGALSFVKGAVVREVEGLLKTLAQEAEREGEPLGLLPRDQIPSWEHVRIYPLGFDQLELKESGESPDQEPERATFLWLGLARAAMAAEEPLDGDAPPDPHTLARTIRAHRREAAYDQVIVGYLLQLAEELKSGKGGEAESVRKKMSALIGELDPGTLQRLVELGGSPSQRRRFVLDANQSLAVDSVMKILQAAAGASQQTISSSLIRLLSKLSVHARSGADRVRDQADTALRDNVESLLENWELEDPNPDAYTLVLDAMARAAPVFAGSDGVDQRKSSGAHRLLQMALEVDSWGPTVAKAVSDLMDQGEVPYVLSLMDAAPPGRKITQRLSDHLTNPSQLRRVLGGADVDERTLQSVAQRMGEAAIPPLLDALTESESRSVRRKVFDVLVRMGDSVGRAIMDRLDEPRWYVVRNMLALVQRLPEAPEGFSVAPFLEHRDHRVRREAFPLAMQDRGYRERALAMGLADSDERLVRMALTELQASLPETLLPVVVSRVIRSSRGGDLKALGVRALRHSRSPLALEALVGVSTAGKTLFGRLKLAPPSVEVAAAVAVLREAWPKEGRTAQILAAARSSRDPDLRQAASGPAGGA